MSDTILVMGEILKYASEVWSHKTISSRQEQNGGIELKGEIAVF